MRLSREQHKAKTCLSVAGRRKKLVTTELTNTDHCCQVPPLSALGFASSLVDCLNCAKNVHMPVTRLVHYPLEATVVLLAFLRQNCFPV